MVEISEVVMNSFTHHEDRDLQKHAAREGMPRLLIIPRLGYIRDRSATAFDESTFVRLLG